MSEGLYIIGELEFFYEGIYALSPMFDATFSGEESSIE